MMAPLRIVLFLLVLGTVSAPWAAEKVRRRTISLTTLPRAEGLKDIRLSAFKEAKPMTPAEFRALWRRARPIPATDPSIAMWSQSPWLEGSFATPEGTHKFTVFLGGLGSLLLPGGGEIAWFQLDSEKKAPGREQP